MTSKPKDQLPSYDKAVASAPTLSNDNDHFRTVINSVAHGQHALAMETIKNKGAETLSDYDYFTAAFRASLGLKTGISILNSNAIDLADMITDRRPLVEKIMKCRGAITLSPREKYVYEKYQDKESDGKYQELPRKILSNEKYLEYAFEELKLSKSMMKGLIQLYVKDNSDYNALNNAFLLIKKDKDLLNTFFAAITIKPEHDYWCIIKICLENKALKCAESFVKEERYKLLLKGLKNFNKYYKASEQATWFAKKQKEKVLKQIMKLSKIIDDDGSIKKHKEEITHFIHDTIKIKNTKKLGIYRELSKHKFKGNDVEVVDKVAGFLADSLEENQDITTLIGDHS